MLFVRQPSLAVLGIVLFGLASGALTLARSEVLARDYAEFFGTANGFLARPVNLAQAGTPLGMGFLLTWTDGYTAGLTLLVTLSLAAAWSMLKVSPPSPLPSSTPQT